MKLSGYIIQRRGVNLSFVLFPPYQTLHLQKGYNSVTMYLYLRGTKVSERDNNLKEVRHMCFNFNCAAIMQLIYRCFGHC